MNARLNGLLHHDAAPGVLLMLAALLALGFDNSPLAWLYDALLSTPVAVKIGAFGIDKPLLLWINDGLMAVFFFLVGLEIKREILLGRLSNWSQATLPAVAALGGMAVPSLIYIAFNIDDAEALQGWAIPAATDIAFALGALALLGSRVPPALKIFLLALAIIDDLGAIVIIALFYTADLSVSSLIGAAACLTILIAFNAIGIRRAGPYVLIGLVMWVCVLKSGIHATLAGVIVALTVPVDGVDEAASPLHRLERELHPWVAFMVMPMFAFANAGVSLTDLSFSDLLQPIPLGIALGLLVGKQIGVFGSTWLAVRYGISRLSEGVGWQHVYGVSLLAGVGFTMSLFIGTLAFVDPEHTTAVRLGVLSG
ncbi:MAG: Na+/H+ antiporter NhaA, partial [Proteobacteria bacterium]|nr:Na+/H+ antiporter NhaA [Pseudomonadota bacterium]